MKRIFIVMGFLLILIMPQAWGSTTQYPNPYRQTMWNNMTDSMHTMGQTPHQARLTKMKLHSARAKARLHSIYLANKAKNRNSVLGNN